uniref:Rab-GAP TBC domain-containing protein n=1 Tax=Trichuris muris TaxID=70415 RepID=A0A5S6QT94_TRIMR
MEYQKLASVPTSSNKSPLTTRGTPFDVQTLKETQHPKALLSTESPVRRCRRNSPGRLFSPLKSKRKEALNGHRLTVQFSGATAKRKREVRLHKCLFAHRELDGFVKSDRLAVLSDKVACKKDALIAGLPTKVVSHGQLTLYGFGMRNLYCWSSCHDDVIFFGVVVGHITAEAINQRRLDALSQPFAVRYSFSRGSIFRLAAHLYLCPAVPAMEEGRCEAQSANQKRSELLNELKRQVKQIMEEAVCMKVIGENSSNLTALCLAVENCLLHGLRKRVFGFFGRATTFTLLHKIAISFPPAASILRITVEVEKKPIEAKSKEEHERIKARRKSLWIRVALVEKVLDLIVDYIAKNAPRYYDEEALMFDSVSGNMVAGLLIGPCALEYTKEALLDDDNCFNGFTISELLQRNQFRASRSMGTGSQSPNLSLTVKRTSSLNADVVDLCQAFVHEHFMSLHESPKCHLLYGKSNIAVRSANSKLLIMGYLSLHQLERGNLRLRWTPNELVHPQHCGSESSKALWDMVFSIDLEIVSCVHCHTAASNNEVMIVFVGHDGVQYPSITFESTLHVLDFLSAIDSSLRPERRLDPNLLTDAGRDTFLAMLSRADQPQNPSCVLKIINVTSFAGNSPVLRRLPYESLKSETSRSSSTSNLEASTELMPADSKDTPRDSVRLAYDSIRHQILCRAFYGWMALSRHMKMIRTHLKSLVKCNVDDYKSIYSNEAPTVLTAEQWTSMRRRLKASDERDAFHCIYVCGCESSIRRYVWPFLLDVHKWTDTNDVIDSRTTAVRQQYEATVIQWRAVESIVRKNEQEILTEAKRFNKERLCSRSETTVPGGSAEFSMSNEVFADSLDESTQNSPVIIASLKNASPFLVDLHKEANHKTYCSQDSGYIGSAQSCQKFTYEKSALEQYAKEVSDTTTQTAGAYPKEVVDNFAKNLRRIDNDVLRCDRNHPYFNDLNLQKLKNVICTYTWEHLDDGYVQGMCDLAAPLLVTFDEEVMTYLCFSKLMERMSLLFPGSSSAMDCCLSYVVQLLQVVDQELFDLVYRNGDYTHCFFCYRWFLLDFKRELTYEDTFAVWETIWCANKHLSTNFSVFVAFGLIQLYRDIIVDNSMEFADIIRFYADMAGKHNVSKVLQMARKMFDQLCTILKS